jgi:hypothetical protein
VRPVPLAQVLPHPQLIFPSKTRFFGIYFNFQWQKSLLNHYCPQSESKSYQINPLNPTHKDLSNNTKGTFQFFGNFQLWFNLIFSEKIIQYSTTSTLQAQTPWNQAHCTPPPQELSKENKNAIWKILVWWIPSIQNKTNKLSSFVDRLSFFKMDFTFGQCEHFNRSWTF